MKNESKRNLYLKVRVSQEEMDGNELRQIGKLANNIANNINQIAARVNATHNIYKEDIEEINNLANQLWKPLLFLQSKVLQLKH